MAEPKTIDEMKAEIDRLKAELQAKDNLIQAQDDVIQTQDTELQNKDDELKTERERADRAEAKIVELVVASTKDDAKLGDFEPVWKGIKKDAEYAQK